MGLSHQGRGGHVSSRSEEAETVSEHEVVK